MDALDAADTLAGQGRKPSLWPGTMIVPAFVVAVGGLVAMRSESPVLSAIGLSVGIAAAVVAVGAAAWRGSRPTAPPRWWHLAWALVFLSGLVFRVRGAETIVEDPLDPWGAYRAGLMAAIAVILLIRLGMERSSWTRTFCCGLIGTLAVYGVVSVASAAWSVFPAWTLYKSLEYLVDVALIAAVVASVRTAQAMRTLFDWTWALLGLLLFAVYAGILLTPDLALVRGIGLIGVQIQGVVPAVSADGVGGLAALLGIVAVARLLPATRHRWFYAFVLAVATATLILAQSRGALLGFLAGGLVVLLAARRAGFVIAAAVAIPTIVWLAGWGPLLQQFVARGQSPELLSSLSGRVDWWTAAWEVVKEQPVIGYGAYAGPRFAVLAALGATTVSTIHNTWVEVLVGTGVLGLLPVLVAFLRTWGVLLSARPRGPEAPRIDHLRIEALGILAALSVGSIFSSDLVTHPPLAFLLIVGYAELLRRTTRGTLR